MNPTTKAEMESGFVVANFYCKSKFEEDCLINVSIEKTSQGEGGRIGGLIRMRAKTEGMALCIGEKIKAL
jgi:coatomer subunit beta